MVKRRSVAGLDGHARSVLAVALVLVSCARRGCRGDTATVVQALAKLPGPTRVTYEAGERGVGWRGAGGGDRVRAGGTGEDRRAAQDRITTDQRLRREVACSD